VTDTLVRPIESTDVEQEVRTSSDKPESSHIVMDADRERDDPQAYLMEARVEGFPVTALCGHVFVPSRSVKSLPVCSECKEIFESEDRSDDSGSGLPDGD
jgi:hypothetical protein